MKIENISIWDTDDLKAFFTKVFKFEGVDPKGYKITIRNARYPHNRDCTGYAYLNSKRLTIGLPNKFWVCNSDGNSHWEIPETMPMPDRVAQVLRHEIHHTIGYKHGEMVASRNLDVPDNLPIVHKKEKKIKPKRDLVMERFNHAKNMLKLHETKLKREQKLVKKWTKKVGYYEKKGLKKE